MLSASERQTLADNQPLKTSRGYTGHEHLDRTGFIHMNGRLYDPQLGRFLGPDPIVAAPGSGQSWNSYSYVSNSPLSFVDPGGQFQAGIGCNVGYVMCMNGGDNTSGRGGGGSGRSTETVTFRTFNFQIGINITQVPVLHDPIGGIFGRGGGGINDDRNGGIFSNVFFGDRLSVRFNLISNFFISITSSTGTRVIQTAEEEQSPSSVPMGVGAHEGPRIAEAALRMQGDTSYSFEAEKGVFQCETWKCNLFVHDVLEQVDIDPPLQPGGPWPLTANSWANRNYEIPGWEIVDSPLPGDVAAIPRSGSPGHVGIYIRDRWGSDVMAANRGGVGWSKSHFYNDYFRSLSHSAGKTVYRRYVGDH